jgi:nitrite reductase (NADH) small subunit
MMQIAEKQTNPWSQACRLEDILPNTGVCCLLGKEQVAVFRVGEGELCYAIGNHDPFSRANVLARGLVGDRAGTLKVASPIYKQSFCLQTGVCLDDPAVRVPVYDVRVTDGIVELRRTATRALLSGNMGMLSEVQSV